MKYENAYQSGFVKGSQFLSVKTVSQTMTRTQGKTTDS